MFLHKPIHFRFAVRCTQCAVVSKLYYFFAEKANIHGYSNNVQAASFWIQRKGKEKSGLLRVLIVHR
jgi:hypothetical protein